MKLEVTKFNGKRKELRYFLKNVETYYSFFFRPGCFWAKKSVFSAENSGFAAHHQRRNEAEKRKSEDVSGVVSENFRLAAHQPIWLLRSTATQPIWLLHLAATQPIWLLCLATTQPIWLLCSAVKKLPLAQTEIYINFSSKMVDVQSVRKDRALMSESSPSRMRIMEGTWCYK